MLTLPAPPPASSQTARPGAHGGSGYFLVSSHDPLSTLATLRTDHHPSALHLPGLPVPSPPHSRSSSQWTQLSSARLPPQRPLRLRQWVQLGTARAAARWPGLLRQTEAGAAVGRLPRAVGAGSPTAPPVAGPRWTHPNGGLWGPRGTGRLTIFSWCNQHVDFSFQLSDLAACLIQNS